MALISVTGTSYQQCQNSKIWCIIGGVGALVSKRPHMEGAITPRQVKKQRSEPVGMIWAPKKPEVYL